jgi:diguanylate cyclase (GGDEF)-like protein/PAS domain S-box-containing protein
VVTPGPFQPAMSRTYDAWGAKENAYPADTMIVSAAGRLDQSALDAVIDDLFANYPTAPMVAIDSNGVFVPMPESVPREAHGVFSGHTSLLDLVVSADSSIIIETWTRARKLGAASGHVHLATDPERSVAIHYVNASHRFGVYLGLLEIEASDASLIALSNVPALKPRVAVVRKDEMAFILRVDDATTQLVGFSAEEMVGQRSLQFLDPEDHGAAISNWMDMLRHPGSSRRVRIRHRHRDGSWVWFEVTNHNLLTDPAHGCVLAEMVDITDEMAAQEALRAREHLLGRLAEALPLGIFQVAPGGTIVYRNERLTSITGREPAESLDQVLAAIVPSYRAVLRQALDAALLSGSDGDVEVELRRRHNDVRRCTFNVRALTGEAGAVTGAIVCVSDVTDSVQMRRELEERATFDVLTRCYNRASILQTLEQTLADNSHSQRGTAVIFIDLDRFKDLNDRLGHAAGDEFLVEVARLLSCAVRDCDVVGRIGGDEFLVVCGEVAGPADAMHIAARIGQSLDRARADSLSAVASIGVAFSRGGELSADTLVARADQAMYRCKRQRRGSPMLFEVLPLEDGKQPRPDAGNAAA